MMRVLIAVISCALVVLGGAFYPEPAAADEFAALLERAEALGRRVVPKASRQHTQSPGFAPYLDLARSAARRHGIPLPLVLAVMEVESGFDPRAVSPKGARGLIQVMPETARDLGIDPARLFDPAVNLDTGVRYLRVLADRYDGHTLSVIAAYNAGPERVALAAPLPRETVEYVDRVRAAYPRYARSLERSLEAQPEDSAAESRASGRMK